MNTIVFCQEPRYGVMHHDIGARLTENTLGGRMTDDLANIDFRKARRCSEIGERRLASHRDGAGQAKSDCGLLADELVVLVLYQLYFLCLPSF